MSLKWNRSPDVRLPELSGDPRVPEWIQRRDDPCARADERLGPRPGGIPRCGAGPEDLARRLGDKSETHERDTQQKRPEEDASRSADEQHR